MIVEHSEGRPLAFGRLGVRTVIAGWIEWYLRRGSIQDPTEIDLARARELPVSAAIVIREQWGQYRLLDGAPQLACRATIEFRP